MKGLFKRVTNSLLALCILGILVGAAMIVYPGNALAVASAIASIYLIVIGLVLIVLDVKAWRLYIPFDGFLPGVLNVLLGILFAVNPAFFADYIGVAFGLWIIVSAFAGIKFAVKLRAVGAPWFLPLVLQIVNICAGVLMILSPTATSMSLTMVLGIVLVVRAVTNLISVIAIKKDAKAVENLIVDTFAAATDAQ